MQAQAVSQAELQAVQAELQGATEMLDSMQQMASSSMQGQEEAQKQMDALTSQLQAAIQVLVSPIMIHSVIVISCLVMGQYRPLLHLTSSGILSVLRAPCQSCFFQQLVTISIGTLLLVQSACQPAVYVQLK